MLRGSDSEKIKQAHHQQLSTYGIGKEKSIAFWKQLAWQLIHRGFCMQDVEHFNVLRLTKKAVPLLRGEEHIMLTVPREEVREASGKKKDRKPTATIPSSPLFELLRTLRRQLADEENKPSFMIFSDATLHEMARINPQTLEQFRSVSGVGQHKLTHYGNAFLDVLRKAKAG